MRCIQLIFLLFLATAHAGCSDKSVPETAQSSESEKLPKTTEQSGMLRITTEPDGAQIFVNGIRKGSSPTEPGQSFAIKLGEGSYIIEAKKTDGEEYLYHGKHEVFVSDNTLQSVAIKLERRQTDQGKRAAQERMQRQATERQQEAERHGYVISADGHTVIDKKTGLMWMRCSLGEIWTESYCSNSPRKYTWEQAKQAAREYSYAGYDDWRLPSIEEFSSLVYCSSGQMKDPDIKNFFGSEGCQGNYSQPTIVKAAFPDTSFENFATRTPGRTDLNAVWFVNFYDGSSAGTAYNSIDDGSYVVRLVRGGR